MEKESIFFCPFDGEKMIEQPLGFLFVKNANGIIYRHGKMIFN